MHTKTYNIQVNNQDYTVDVTYLTSDELLIRVRELEGFDLILDTEDFSIEGIVDLLSEVI